MRENKAARVGDRREILEGRGPGAMIKLVKHTTLFDFVDLVSHGAIPLRFACTATQFAPPQSIFGS